MSLSEKSCVRDTLSVVRSHDTQPRFMYEARPPRVSGVRPKSPRSSQRNWSSVGCGTVAFFFTAA